MPACPTSPARRLAADLHLHHATSPTTRGAPTRSVPHDIHKTLKTGKDAEHYIAFIHGCGRQLGDRIVQNQLSEHTAQLNETTRKLAAWAAIIGVPSVVTGFYGQNVPFPGADRLSGFVTSTVIMLGLAVGLYWLLRRNRWL